MASSSNNVLLLLLLINFAFCIGNLIYALSLHRVIVQLERDGTVTTGTITQVTRRATGKSVRFRAYYQFYTESGEWIGNQEISRKHYKQLAIGDQVSVCYLLTNPDVSQLAGDDTDHTKRDGAFIGASILFVILVILPLLWR